MKRIILLTLIISIFLTACGAEESTTVYDSEKTETSAVPLEEVKAPSFEEDFCTLSFDDTYWSVRWGAGTGCVMWKESGYPGFDYPMIVSTIQPVTSAEVKLTLSWGEYVYYRLSAGKAFSESGNLIDKDSGEKLVDWGHSKEILILWDVNSEYYSLYEFQEGTEIIE